MIGKIDTNWLRNFILSTVKPLKSGKVVKTTQDQASMDNLFPDGFSDKFKLAQPFGFVANVPRGVSGFYQNLFGSGHESIILGLLHKLRPQPTAPGSTTIYSTTADGQTIRVTIKLNADGSLDITAPTKVVVNSPTIELGGSGLEKILNGETFLSEYKTHLHLDSWGLPVSTPTAVRPVSDSAQLSGTVKAKK